VIGISLLTHAARSPTFLYDAVDLLERQTQRLGDRGRGNVLLDERNHAVRGSDVQFRLVRGGPFAFVSEGFVNFV